MTRRPSADLSIPTGVTRRQQTVGRTDRHPAAHTPGPHQLPIGHWVALEITDDAAHRQFGIAYRSEGEQVWAPGWGSPVIEVLADDAAGRGWWVTHNDYRAVLVQPTDLLEVHDTGPADTPEQIRAMWDAIRADDGIPGRPVEPVPVQGVLL